MLRTILRNTLDRSSRTWGNTKPDTGRQQTLQGDADNIRRIAKGKSKSTSKGYVC